MYYLTLEKIERDKIEQARASPNLHRAKISDLVNRSQVTTPSVAQYLTPMNESKDAGPIPLIKVDGDGFSVVEGSNLSRYDTVLYSFIF